MKHKKILISVVVCTYNRAGLLANCLKSLKNQTADKNFYEVIIVDNNSIDNTQEIAESFISNRASFRIIKEKHQGLSYARNKGWQEAKGKYVAYIDDDAEAKPDWIEQIAHFLKTHPKVKVFGGPYSRFFRTSPPVWLPENYSTLNLGSRIKALNVKNEWISGSNMIFNKILFYKYGGFNTDFEGKGAKVIYGEEIEFLTRLKKTGESVFYVPTIRVKHLVAECKLNLWGLLKNDYSRGFSISLMNKDKLDLLRGLFYLIKSLFLFPFYFIMLTKDPWMRKVYFGLCNISGSLGRISGSIRRIN